MGGIAGHAGVFSTARDIGTILAYMLGASLEQQRQGINGGDSGGSGVTPHEKDDFDSFLNASTVALFTTLVNASQSSRALGWSINTQQV